MLALVSVSACKSSPKPTATTPAAPSTAPEAPRVKDEAPQPSRAVAIIAPLTDPGKLDTLAGARAATPRLRKACYWLEVARSEGVEPLAVIEAAQRRNGSHGTERAKAVAESLLRNRTILERLGCLDAEVEDWEGPDHYPWPLQRRDRHRGSHYSSVSLPRAGQQALQPGVHARDDQSAEGSKGGAKAGSACSEVARGGVAVSGGTGCG
jgi:hypothetical protein